MQLKALSVRKTFIAKPEHHYALQGTIVFEEENVGEIQLILDEEAVKQIILVCAETLTRVSKEASEKLHQAITSAIQITGSVVVTLNGEVSDA